MRKDKTHMYIFREERGLDILHVKGLACAKTTSTWCKFQGTIANCNREDIFFVKIVWLN